MTNYIVNPVLEKVAEEHYDFWSGRNQPTQLEYAQVTVKGKLYDVNSHGQSVTLRESVWDSREPQQVLRWRKTEFDKAFNSGEIVGVTRNY